MNSWKNEARHGGEENLETLLSSLEPVLSAERFVFVNRPPASPPAVSLALQAWAFIRETEGCTLILEEPAASRHGLIPASGTIPVFRRITLTVHSSLEAVGLTAAVSGVLAVAGISANVVAAFHHDHIFVPDSRAAEALGLLKALAERPPDSSPAAR